MCPSYKWLCDNGTLWSEWEMQTVLSFNEEEVAGALNLIRVSPISEQSEDDDSMDEQEETQVETQVGAEG